MRYLVFIIYNKPEATRRVFEAIRQWRPSHLYVIADGPKNAKDAIACAQARSILVDVDWPCELKTDLSDVNLGCRQRVVSGLDAVFQIADSAIVLEDDCLPHPHFFTFCNEGLDEYASDERVMHINGTNLAVAHESHLGIDQPFYFTHLTHVWGWATWRRAWQTYMTAPELLGKKDLSQKLTQVLALPNTRELYLTQARDIASGRLDTWDVQWQLTCAYHHGLCITPAGNYIQNIGFGSQATHTKIRGKYTEIPYLIPQMTEEREIAPVVDMRLQRLVEAAAPSAHLIKLKNSLLVWKKNLQKLISRSLPVKSLR